MKISRFASLDSPPPGEVQALTAAFKADPSPDKVFLGVGAYRDHRGRPWVLPAVQKAKQRLALDPSQTHEYLPMSGDPGFVRHAQRLIFGDLATEKSIASIQTVSGTGANHVGARFLAEALRPRTVWVSDPSWLNHAAIWRMVQPLASDGSRGLQIRYYPYYNQENHCLEFESMIAVLEADAAVDDVLIMQPCGHNPSGKDLTREQWRIVAELCIRKQLFPFFDVAYQGFATGSMVDDVWPVRLFFEQGMEMCVAQSFAKSMGLYGERVGALHLVTVSDDGATKTLQKLLQVQRSETASPPAFGAKVARTILSDPEILEEWQQNMREMVLRLKQVRFALWDELNRLETPGSWDFILTGAGMFLCTGLDSQQVDELRTRFHIFILGSGRVSLPGLNEGNIKYVAGAIDTVVRATVG